MKKQLQLIHRKLNSNDQIKSLGSELVQNLPFAFLTGGVTSYMKKKKSSLFLLSSFKKIESKYEMKKDVFEKQGKDLEEITHKYEQVNKRWSLWKKNIGDLLEDQNIELLGKMGQDERAEEVLAQVLENRKLRDEKHDDQELDQSNQESLEEDDNDIDLTEKQQQLSDTDNKIKL